MTLPVEINIDAVHEKIDFGIITIREDEFKAVLRKFTPKWLAKGERHYNIAEISIGDGDPYYAAIIRTPEQGQHEAQLAATNLINDLDPSCLVLVGICGAKPEDEFTLGDVVVATRLHDFSVGAALPGGDSEMANQGGAIHPMVQVALANLPAVEKLLGNWNSSRAIGTKRPKLELEKLTVHGDEEWKKKVQHSLEYNFCPPNVRRRSIVTAASVAAGNILVKDPVLLKGWLEHARDLKIVEMELPGVYRAARSVRGDRPVLAIRGISDIVGLQRDPRWTEYACRSAASFARAYLATSQLDIVPKPKADNNVRRNHLPYVASDEYRTLEEAADLTELLTAAIELVSLATNTDYNQIFLIATTFYSKLLFTVADKVSPGKQRYRVATFEGLLGTAFESGKTMNINDVRKRVNYFQAVLETRSELVVPIKNIRSVLGVINSESEIVDYYNSDIVKRVELIADCLGDLLPRKGWSQKIPPQHLPWIACGDNSPR